MKRNIKIISFLILAIILALQSLLNAQTIQANSYLSPKLVIETNSFLENFSQKSETGEILIDLLDVLERELPWKTITRFPHFKRPTSENDYHTKYWKNQLDMRIYMLNIIHNENIEELTLNEFKKILKEAHKYVASGKNEDRFYKLRPQNLNKEKEIETGGQFRSNLPRTAETNNFEEIHRNILIASEQIRDKYGVQDPFITSWRYEGTIRLKDIPEHALPNNQYYNMFENPYDAYIANNHPLWEYADYYFAKMLESFKKCYQNTANPKALIRDLAEFYQYSINLMPFESINNSMFMNIVNMFLEEAGLNAIAHGNMDFAAFDLQQNTFLLYFFDKVAEENPELLKHFNISTKNTLFTNLLEAGNKIEHEKHLNIVMLLEQAI